MATVSRCPVCARCAEPHVLTRLLAQTEPHQASLQRPPSLLFALTLPRAAQWKARASAQGLSLAAKCCWKFASYASLQCAAANLRRCAGREEREGVLTSSPQILGSLVVPRPSAPHKRCKCSPAEHLRMGPRIHEYESSRKETCMHRSCTEAYLPQRLISGEPVASTRGAPKQGDRARWQHTH
jgi:hypothetical protein